MSDPFVGEVRMFGFSRVPQGWLACDGSLQSIAEYETLYVLLGTTYGGDGVQTFAVPDMRGRVALHQGQAPVSTNRVLGQTGGTETVTLTTDQLPAHTHGWMAAVDGTRTGSASGTLLGTGEADLFNHDTSNGPTGPGFSQIGTTGNSQPHQNMQPTLCINVCIAWAGVFPSQS
jgi:microcystin-dependent protein